MKLNRTMAIAVLVSTVLTGCGVETSAKNEHVHVGVVDITDVILANRSPDCGAYVGEYSASATDEKNQKTFISNVVVTATDVDCTITSNSVPNHNFNDATAEFAGGREGATISEVESVHTISRKPKFAVKPTFISQEIKNAIFLNGVLLDILSAGCYRPESEDAGPDGNVGIGCASDAAWLLDPLGTEAKFGADAHNAHTQPGGLYHYHGGPNALFEDSVSLDGSPVIGFAADGFPIYGSFFRDPGTGTVRRAVSGYTLRKGTRGERSDVNPGGLYTGEYNDDWVFSDAGDLDECNGMMIDDQYGYYVTNAYPWVLKCLRGTPHESFVRRRAGPPPPRD